MSKVSSRLQRGYGVYIVPGLVLTGLVIVLPFLVNVFVSFSRWNGVQQPKWVGIANYIRAFGDETFWASFVNNLLMILAVTVIPTLLGLLLAVILFDTISKKFGNGPVAFLKAGFYLPQILPVVIAGIVWGWILEPETGALNSFFRAIGLDGLALNWLGDPATALPSVMGIMVWFQLGYPLVIFIAALQRVDVSVLEAAAIDGANSWQRFKMISYLIRPEILVVVLTTTIYALKLFGPIFVLTRGGPGTATIVPSYFAYQNFFEKANVGYGAAIATIMTLIIIILTVFFIRVQAKQERIEEV